MCRWLDGVADEVTRRLDKTNNLRDRDRGCDCDGDGD
jgi:hypothetical protein